MFLLLNGSFGVGKTSAARAVRRLRPGTRIYDPGPIGIAMQRAARALALDSADDFQDFAPWRRVTATVARAWHLGADAVIVPMTFSNAAYLDEIADQLGRTAPVVRACLVAPLAVVEQRLAARAAQGGPPSGPWERRRASECCKAHRHPIFGHPIDATADVSTVAAALLSLLER